MLRCLLTVLFLLDFIKTPSAVSSGMVEGVAEEEMEEERQREKSERFWRQNGGRTADSRGEHGLLSEGHRQHKQNLIARANKGRRKCVHTFFWVCLFFFLSLLMECSLTMVFFSTELEILH